MMELRTGKHFATGQTIIEVWNGQQLMGAIYPAEDGVRVVSRHLTDVRRDDREPPSVTVVFRSAKQ